MQNPIFKTDWKILTHVLSNHYSSRITTTQNLIHYSGLTQATGIRRIKILIDNKFLYKKKRSKTGKSFSIHPSSNLIKKFDLFLISLENYKTRNIDTSNLKNQINSKSNSASSRYVLYPKI